MRDKSTLRSTVSNLRAAICSVVVCAAAISVQADTITVTTTADSGPGSLRQALADANDGDTINFTVTGTIALTSDELAVDKSVTISGPGPTLLAVWGYVTLNAGIRVFHVTPNHTVTIEGLTISYGGGGIYNDQATLTVNNCAVTYNSANGGDGGGINNASGTLIIINSTVRGNSADGAAAFLAMTEYSQLPAAQSLIISPSSRAAAFPPAEQQSRSAIAPSVATQLAAATTTYQARAAVFLARGRLATVPLAGTRRGGTTASRDLAWAVVSIPSESRSPIAS